VTRTPPPVGIDIRSEPAWLAVQCWVFGLTVSVVGAWAAALGDLPTPWRWTAAAAGLPVAWLAGIAAKALGHHRDPVRVIFDGQAWSFSVPGPHPRPGRCAPVVAMDLGHWMLLRLDPALPAAESVPSGWAHRIMRRRWVALSRRSAAAHWHGLRVALYCSESGTDRPSG
jgi:hypothetical protein